MEFKFYERHVVADNEHYYSVIDELRRPSPNGFDQLLVAHIDFHQFSKDTFARILREWAVLRSVIEAPLFAYCADGDQEPQKWERFVRLLGFEEVPSAILPASDGSSRRVFVSYKVFNASEANNHRIKNYKSVGPADSLPDAGVRQRSEHL